MQRETAALVAPRHMEVNVKRRLRLRPATPHDCSLLTHWDAQPHVISANPDDSWDWKTELAHQADWRQQFIAEREGRPIGFVQIIDPAREDGSYWGESANGLRAIDIWIGEPEELGKGYGTTMMQLALAHCFADPEVSAVLIDPLADNHRAHRFYERLGFRFVEQRHLGGNTCCIYRLDRRDWLA
ncbi:GNAT family N-acetyltransferase [Halomonas sp. A29]|uniref:GNAT family N-acetyltransferase n=1 Tax=Halomonas sp. A29 TaxID=3102786 RepID=UPI00398B44EA